MRRWKKKHSKHTLCFLSSDVVFADSVLDCTRKELLNGRSVSEAPWPQCSCVTVPGSWQCYPLALYPQDQEQFPAGRSHGLRVRTVIYSPSAKTRGWGDSGCVCVVLLCKQSHTHEAIVESGAVWAAHEGRVCSQVQTQPPQQPACFTSSLKSLPTILLCLLPHKSASWPPAQAASSELKGQAAGSAPPVSFYFTILHSCTARLGKKAAAYLRAFFRKLSSISKIRPSIWWISHGLYAQLWTETFWKLCLLFDISVKSPIWRKWSIVLVQQISNVPQFYLYSSFTIQYILSVYIMKKV